MKGGNMSDYGTCPNCGGDLVKKSGKYGDFLSCSNFPKCRFSMDYNEGDVEFNNSTDYGSCPDCGADLIVKNGKRGIFLSCSNFPQCRYSRDI